MISTLEKRFISYEEAAILLNYFGWERTAYIERVSKENEAFDVGEWFMYLTLFGRGKELKPLVMPFEGMSQQERAAWLEKPEAASWNVDMKVIMKLSDEAFSRAFGAYKLMR